MLIMSVLVGQSTILVQPEIFQQLLDYDGNDFDGFCSSATSRSKFYPVNCLNLHVMNGRK